MKVQDQVNMADHKPMTPEEKKRDLYERQKRLLDTFLEHGAIGREQYEKSLSDLTVKMGFRQAGENRGNSLTENISTETELVFFDLILMKEPEKKADCGG